MSCQTMSGSAHARDTLLPSRLLTGEGDGPLGSLTWNAQGCEQQAPAVERRAWPSNALGGGELQGDIGT